MSGFILFALCLMLSLLWKMEETSVSWLITVLALILPYFRCMAVQILLLKNYVPCIKHLNIKDKVKLTVSNEQQKIYNLWNLRCNY